MAMAMATADRGNLYLLLNQEQFDLPQEPQINNPIPGLPGKAAAINLKPGEVMGSDRLAGTRDRFAWLVVMLAVGVGPAWRTGPCPDTCAAALQK